MFDHVTIRVSDRAASARFYDLLLGTLGVGRTSVDEQFPEWSDFSVAAASPERPVTRGLHLGFVASSRALVDAVWEAGTAAGYRDDGRPGPRPQYRDDYYGAFLLDPDGNSVEAVHHGDLRVGGVVDHLWIRVADLAAARRFYETIAPHAGLRPIEAVPERATFAGRSGSFSLVLGPSTEHLHVAFPSDEDAVVDAFHAAAVAAGYPDEGSPGERTVYHPGSYAAFVRDPDTMPHIQLTYRRGAAKASGKVWRWLEP